MGFELMTSSLPRMRSTPELHRQRGAENEVRTRDPQLGRLMLYQLSYFRDTYCGREGIRTPEGVRQQISSLPQLATLVPSRYFFQSSQTCRADRGIRTHDPEITNHVLWPTELYRQCFSVSSEMDCKDKGLFLQSKFFSLKISHFFQLREYSVRVYATFVPLRTLSVLRNEPVRNSKPLHPHSFLH